MGAWVGDVAFIVLWVVSLLGLLALSAGIVKINKEPFGFFCSIVIFFGGIINVMDSYSDTETVQVTVKSLNIPEVESGIELGADEGGVGIGLSQKVKSTNPILEVFEVAVRDESTRKLVVYTNRDDLFRWKFDSQAIQLDFKPEKRFTLTVYGFLGNKNILDAVPIEEKKTPQNS